MTKTGTDIEKVKSLLSELGVGFKVKGGDRDNPGGQNIKCQEGYKKVGGYPWFYTNFEFDKDGKFILMSVWE